jgi:hypothetical protein
MKIIIERKIKIVYAYVFNSVVSAIGEVEIIGLMVYILST